MIEGTQPSQELMEKNLLLTQEDWMNILADWSGSQKDTECGIRILCTYFWEIKPTKAEKNPYGCWICDIIFIIEQLRTLIVPKDDSPEGEPK